MWQPFKERFFVKFWSPMPTIIALGILSTYYFGLTGTFWAVTGEFTRWGGHLLEIFGVSGVREWSYFKTIGFQGTPLDRVDGVMILGMFVGCFSAALWADNVKWRQVASKRRIFQAIVGGIIAGFGARLAMGCNLAAFFTGIPQFSLHAWFFAFATLVGTFIGVKVAMLPFLRIHAKPKSVTEATPLFKDHERAKFQFILGSALLFAFVLFAVFKGSAVPKLGIAALFGIGFGLCIQRAQVCFTSAFRDMWLTGRTLMAKAIVFGMAVSAIGIFAFIQAGLEPRIFWAAPSAVIGGLLFGFGIVLAGGCETGWMYRAVEGQLHFWWVGLGNVIGSTLVAYFWDDLKFYFVDGYEKVNLLQVFGPYGGLSFNYLLMGLSLVGILLWERYFFAKKTKYKNVSKEA